MLFTFVLVMAVAILSSASTGQLIPGTFAPDVQPHPTGVPVPIDSEPSTLEPMPSQTAMPAGHDEDEDEGDDDENSPEITSMPTMPTGSEPKTLDPDPSSTIPLIPENSSIQMIPESNMMSATIQTPQASQHYSRHVKVAKRLKRGPLSVSPVLDESTMSEISTPNPTSLTQMLPESNMMSATTQGPQASQYYHRYRRAPRHLKGGPVFSSSIPDTTTTEISTPDPTSLTQMLPESNMWATTQAGSQHGRRGDTAEISSPGPTPCYTHTTEIDPSTICSADAHCTSKTC